VLAVGARMSLGLDGSSEGSRGEFVRFWAEQGEEPAFVRRAREVEAGWTDLLRRCELKRGEMLRWARMRLADVARLVGNDWTRGLDSLVNPEQATRLAALYEQWKPLMPGYVTGENRASTGRASGTRASNPWATVTGSLVAYAETAARFNAAWEKYLREVDLSAINRQRADFNIYYPIEKAAAFETQDVARLGFLPMEPASIEDVRAAFPALEVPAMKP
jgi:hypothetical protein